MSFWDDLAGNGDSATQQYLQQALKQYQTIQVPTEDSGKVTNIPQETVQGTVTPQEIKAVDQDPSAYNNISLDPQSRQAMINALQGYQTIADDGGLDANAKLGIQQVVDAANTQSRGAQGAIQQQAQAMGQGGGDFALTQRAIAAQGASNNASTQGLQMAAEAEANREAALSNLSSIGGQINNSDYNQAAQKASAQNAINATNQGYQNAANVGNVANNATAQQFNVTNAQGVNASNTAANQNNAYYNASLAQQKFNNELAKANGAANVYGAQAKQATASNSANDAALGKLAGGVGQGVSSYYGAGGGGAGAAPAHTNGAIASTPAYQQNMQSNSPLGYSSGGAVCYAKGGVSMPHNHEICLGMGGEVPGTPTVPGDSQLNDKVDAKLSPGELVIPVSVPKTGPAMEAFAKQAPVPGSNRKVDLTSFTQGYRRPR